ncbi:hypothetical protein ABW19_dt0203443 [Dactylella cylindrospora]|nr:hypothetical protein ABW19_dt0203443 [Dactylella cylindrospora]
MGEANDTKIYYGLRISGIFDIQYYDATDDNKTIESVFETLNNTHTGFFYAYFCIVVVIATFVHVFRKFYVRKRALRLRMTKFANSGRVIRAFFLKKGYWGLPTRAHFAIVVLYLFVNVWVSLWSSKPTLLLIQLARKTGWFSVVNGTLLVFLAMKNTPLAWLTGFSYEKLNVFHRWVAVTALVQGAVHTIAVSVGLSRLIPSQVGALLLPANVWGIITLAFWMIILASFYLLKRIRYEVFYVMHLVLFPATYIACLLHNYHAYGPIGTAFGVYFIDKAVRYNRIFWHNRYADKLKAKVQLTRDGMTIVRIPRGNLMWKPGTHAFLCMPGIRYFESHPFSICSVGDDIDTEGGKKTLDFIIKPEDGFTKAMNWEARLITEKKVVEETRELRAIIDGPYGAMPNFNDFDNLFLYATGSGITFTLPIALSAVRKARVRHLEFIWCTKKAMSYENIRPQLEELARGGHGIEGQTTYVVIRLHETDPDKKRGNKFGGAMQRMKSTFQPTMRGLPFGRRGRAAERDAQPDETSTLISRDSTDVPPVPSMPASLQQKPGHSRSYSGDVMPSSAGFGPSSGEDPTGALRSPPMQSTRGVSMGKRTSGYFKAPTSEDHTIFEEDYGQPRASTDMYAGMSDDDPDPDHVPSDHDSSDERTLGGARGIDDYSSDEDDDNEKGGIVGGAHQDVRDALDRFIYEGRPNMKELIKNFVNSCGPDETCALASCGPGSDTVRAQAAECIKKGGPSVSLFVEEFGW